MRLDPRDIHVCVCVYLVNFWSSFKELCKKNYVWEEVHICVEVRGPFVDLVLSFQHVGPGDETQVIRLGSKYLYLLSYRFGPCSISSYVICGCPD